MRNRILLIVASLSLLTSCSQLDCTVKESDCLVSFSFAGDIVTSDSPLTKATTDDIYIAQVIELGSNSFFASAIYDDPTKIKFYLKKGSNYRIIISMLKNGKTTLGDVYNTSLNCIKIPIHSLSYYVGDRNWDINNGTLSWWYSNIGAIGDFLWLAMNREYYNSVDVCYYYGQNVYPPSYLQTKSFNSNSYLIGFRFIENAALGEDKYPQYDDWFYGEINNYSPTGEYESLSMDFKRVGFKLKYELTGVTDGEVTVKVYKENEYHNVIKTFIDNTTSTSTYASDPLFFAFNDAHSAWQYADDYMENMTLSVSWLRGIGITEDYGTKTIQIKRNCLNNIKINLGNNDQSAGLSMTVESESSIGSESVTIPVE